jgi:hypothetical protein
MTPAECYRLSAAYDFFGLVNGSRCIGFTSLRQAAVAAAWNESLVEYEDGGGEFYLHRQYCMGPCTGGGNATCGGNSTTMQLYARNKPVPQLAPPVPGKGTSREERGGAGQWRSAPSCLGTLKEDAGKQQHSMSVLLSTAHICLSAGSMGFKSIRMARPPPDCCLPSAPSPTDSHPAPRTRTRCC